LQFTHQTFGEGGNDPLHTSLFKTKWPQRTEDTRGVQKYTLWGKMDQQCKQNSNNFKEQISASVQMQLV